MRRVLISTFAILAAALGQTDKRVVPVEVSHRLALVIGNLNYRSLPAIPPARYDALDVGTELTRLGFQVTVLNDLSLVELIRAIAAFRGKIQPGDLAFIYYSGHGGQLDEENYLLPVDYEPPSRVDADLVPRRAYKMSELRDKIEGSTARVRVFVFDACRSSPLLTTKESAKDYAPVSGKPEGTIIAFASAHLQPAGFTPGNRNSDYTQELLAALRQPRLPDLEALLMDVRGRVFQRTNRTQTPYLYGFLSGPLYLTGAPPVVVTNEVTTLLLEVDADATVVVDDQPGVSVKAGQMRRFNVAPGTHFLRASAGEAMVRKTVEVRHGEQQAVTIELARAIEEQKLNGLVGLWTEQKVSDGTLSGTQRRYHGTVTERVQMSRGTGRNELMATFYEEQVIKGIDDSKSDTDNFTRTYEAVFRLRLEGAELNGSSDSASWKTNGTKQQYSSVPFKGTLLDSRRINFEIVWEKAPDGVEVAAIRGTLTK